MKNIVKAGIAIVVAAFVLYSISFLPSSKTDSDIKMEARQASVQPMFDVPVIKAYFSKPLKEEQALTHKDLDELIKAQNEERDKLKEEIEAVVEEIVSDKFKLQNEAKYEKYLTYFEEYGVLPFNKDKIVLGFLSPTWAKFPENVLLVYKVDIRKVSYKDEEDISTISELANVSMSAAKDIVSRLKLEGYSVNKESASPDSETKLMWFWEGWTKSPIELKWEVTLENSKENIICGYDPRGIILIRSVPEDTRVRVKAGYIDLMDEFKPKTSELEAKERIIDDLQKKLKEKEDAWESEVKSLKDELEEFNKVEETKRDISNATMFDVMVGDVNIERFWYRTAASGIFLGNSKVTKEMKGFQSFFIDMYFTFGEEKAFILTNAHVATMALKFEVYVSKNKEIMWIILPAISSIRYTQDSDMYGSPAQVLAVDGSPVVSWDYDCAVMVTSKVPGYDHKVILGDSDKVSEGDKVTMVGNPAMLQKFLTVGRVANTDYSLMKSHLIDFYLNSGMSRNSYNWILNTNFWFDTPIGTGGTSGSGVWSMEGSERGKVVAIHHAGIVRPSIFAPDISEGKKIKPDFISADLKIGSVTKEMWKKVFNDFDYKDAKFSLGYDSFVKDNPTFIDIMQKRGSQELSGLNAGIKINNVKLFLQERGLNPEEFGWEKAKGSYWTK
jgi:Skp family chaperone for outer membrane proteins